MNYFNSSPQGKHSHFKPKKAATVKKQRHMKEAWASFLAVHNMDKKGLKKAITRICKVQSFFSHCSQREGIMAKLEKNGYAYMQSALDHSLQRVLHDEITDFISNTKKEWKKFSHSSSDEYLPLPMSLPVIWSIHSTCKFRFLAPH